MAKTTYTLDVEDEGEKGFSVAIYDEENLLYGRSGIEGVSEVKKYISYCFDDLIDDFSD